MPVSSDPGELNAAADLITLLQALPNCRMRHGVHYPQWWMLLVVIQETLSGQGYLGPPEKGKSTAAQLVSVIEAR